MHPKNFVGCTLITALCCFTLALLAFSTCDGFIMGYGRPRNGNAAKRLDKRLFSLYGISPPSSTVSGDAAAPPSFNSLITPYDSYDASDMLSYDAAARLSSAAAAAAAQLRLEQQQQQALLGELLYAAATSADGVGPADVAEAARRERQLRTTQRQQQRAALLNSGGGSSSSKDLDSAKVSKV